MSAADHEALLVQLARTTGEWVDVGILNHQGEAVWFETLASYWQLVDRPVLGQVFEERGPTWRPSSRVQLPNWFSHLLPEGQLRNAVAQAANVNSKREFFLLERIGGDDLPGALRVLRFDDVLERAAPGAEATAGDLVDDLGPLKFSLAGIQLKFSVRYGAQGLTVPARGEAGDWIAKFPDQRRGFDGVPEAEFASLELARASGIDVPEARLVDVPEIRGLPDWATSIGGRALLISRFDREAGGGRVHVEELAQVLDIPTGHEYEQARYGLGT